jgi:triphosphoribosyl-dephospho-CoA synthetase
MSGRGRRARGRRLSTAPLVHALGQVRERLDRVATPDEVRSLRRTLEDLVAQVEDRIILAYEGGGGDGAVLQAAGDVLSYALEMVVAGDKEKALRALTRAIALLSPQREGG